MLCDPPVPDMEFAYIVETMRTSQRIRDVIGKIAEFHGRYLFSILTQSLVELSRSKSSTKNLRRKILTPPLRIREPPRVPPQVETPSRRLQPLPLYHHQNSQSFQISRRRSSRSSRPTEQTIARKRLRRPCSTTSSLITALSRCCWL